MPIKIKLTPSMIIIIPAGETFPARPTSPRLVTMIRTDGPTRANNEFIFKAVSTRPYFNISMAAVNSMHAEITRTPAMPKTILSLINNK